MKLLIQRVNSASLEVNSTIVSEIKKGLIVFLGISKEDTYKDCDFFIKKLLNLRIFDDEKEIPNLSVQDSDGEILLVSQFTLYGNCKKGRRPSYELAASSSQAEPIYDYFLKNLISNYPKVKSGIFGAHMNITYTNDGPISLIIEK